MNGKAVHSTSGRADFDDVDILIGSTACARITCLTLQRVGAADADRQDRPLFCIDLAVPRDIEPAVNDLEVSIYMTSIRCRRSPTTR
jgi:glutamyl-tRNA reductase